MNLELLRSTIMAASQLCVRWQGLRQDLIRTLLAVVEPLTADVRNSTKTPVNETNMVFSRNHRGHLVKNCLICVRVRGPLIVQHSV